MSGQKTMRASIFLGEGRMEIREVPVPQPGEGLVLFRVVSCGVSATDYRIFTDDLTDRIRPPVVLGHEIAVRVEDLGEGVENLAVGDFGAIDPLIACRLCPMCRAGRPNLCEAQAILGGTLDGGFAEYLLAPPEQFVAMSESTGPDGAVLCEALGCVLNGLDRLGLRPGDGAMILGAGAAGMLWAQVLARWPVRYLIQTEIVEFRKRIAVNLGADLLADPLSTDLSERVYAEMPYGADCIIDATGSPEAIREAIGLLAPGGTLLLFGVCPAGSEVAFDPNELWAGEARIIASRMSPHRLDGAARLIEQGWVAADEIVTATLPLDGAADAVAGFADRRDEQVKVAIDPWA